jgi:hypothetical protein
MAVSSITSNPNVVGNDSSVGDVKATPPKDNNAKADSVTQSLGNQSEKITARSCFAKAAKFFAGAGTTFMASGAIASFVGGLGIGVPMLITGGVCLAASLAFSLFENACEQHIDHNKPFNAAFLKNLCKGTMGSFAKNLTQALSLITSKIIKAEQSAKKEETDSPLAPPTPPTVQDAIEVGSNLVGGGLGVCGDFMAAKAGGIVSHLTEKHQKKNVSNVSNE